MQFQVAASRLKTTERVWKQDGSTVVGKRWSTESPEGFCFQCHLVLLVQKVSKRTTAEGLFVCTFWKLWSVIMNKTLFFFNTISHPGTHPLIHLPFISLTFLEQPHSLFLFIPFLFYIIWLRQLPCMLRLTHTSLLFPVSSSSSSPSWLQREEGLHVLCLLLFFAVGSLSKKRKRREWRGRGRLARETAGEEK